MKQGMIAAALTVALCAVPAAPGTAQSAPAGNEAAPPATASADTSRTVCRSIRRTGTRFSTRTCRTVAQWEEMSQVHQRTVRELTNRPVIRIGREQ